MKIDIKGEGVKSFKLEIKDFNLNERIDLNNLLYKFFNNNEGMFGPAIDIVRISTDLSDEEIEEAYEEMRLRQGARMIDEYGMEEDIVDEYGMEEEYVGEASMEEGYLEEDFFLEEDMEENPDLETRIRRLEDAMLG